ncbi:twin-arginine translocase subunit TatC [Planctomonas psychrotolerans]|uniref:twin-arginine translocase subunit TatC n=1 Tax=Planctomonas psychrotolerans TaxID=2528712 RepID=UPI00123A4B69|nr:twin-arginine translocase subunit TatC [Planctomonas psychrotolerans]
MSLGQHLLELRKRLFISGIAVVLAAIGGWFLSDFILDALREPILEVGEDQGRAATLNYETITSAFDLKLQISLYAGLIISSPVWLYQIFAFLVPGLTQKEKRYTFGFFFSAVPLFLLGCIAGWWVLPHIVELLTRFAGMEDSSLITARQYFDFVLKLVFAVGIAFVLPAFLVLFNAMSILSGETILKSWRLAILAITVFCAIATPAADVMSMFLLAIPMIGLYLIAAAIAVFNDRRRARKVRVMEAEYGLS